MLEAKTVVRNEGFHGQPLTLYADNPVVKILAGWQEPDGELTQQQVSSQEIDDSSFELVARLEYPDEYPTLFLNGQPLVLQSAQASSVQDDMPQIINYFDVGLDIAFVRDGTMSEANFEAGLALMQAIVQQTAHHYDRVRYAGVIYGEYQKTFNDKRVWNSDLDVLSLTDGQFVTEDSFHQIIGQARSMTPFQHNYSDALELGLQYMNRLTWSQEYSFLVLIGNSPPHPDRAEMNTYNLIDRNTEEFYNIRWWGEVMDLTKRVPAHLHLCSIWLHPQYHRPRPEQRDYSRHVWERLGQTFYREINASQASACASALQQAIQTTLPGSVQKLDRETMWPFIAPLKLEG